VNVRELVNRTNKKKLYTECSFKINEDTFKIVRTQLPDTIQIFKNDKDFELESSKKLIQDEINRIIGIDYNMFRQIIALGINYNKSFLEMEKNEKREIIESITNVKILGEMLKNLKINISNLKTQRQINKSTIDILEQNLYQSDVRLQELTKAKNNFDKDLKAELEKIDEKLISQRKELKDNKKKLEKLKEKIEDVKVFEKRLKEIKDEISKISKSINVNRYKEEIAKETLKFFEMNNICSSCNQEITEEHKSSEILKLNETIKDSSKTTMANESLLEVLENEDSLIRSNITKQEKLQFDVESLKQKIKWNETEITNNEKRREETINKKLDFDVESLQKEFDENTQKYLELFDKDEKQSIELNNYEIVSSIISDNGIKAYFFKKIMPILNNKINDYLKTFDMRVKIEINELLEDKITSLDFQKNEISYFSHSEGEKKKIDISILLAFIDMTKIICAWDCSLLIFDEILDAKVDEDGLETIINTLRNFTVNNKKLCSYVISHRMQESDAFDRHFRLSKASGFSKITRIV
jgi:DNA repair exonuclease SbcCD ATPase subunit